MQATAVVRPEESAAAADLERLVAEDLAASGAEAADQETVQAATAATG